MGWSNPHEAASFVAALEARFPRIVAPRTDDICYATANRQAAVKVIAARCQAFRAASRGVLKVGLQWMAFGWRAVAVSLRGYGVGSVFVRELEVVPAATKPPGGCA